MEKKIIEGVEQVKYQSPISSDEKLLSRSKEFYEQMNERRTVREFDSRPIPSEVIENIILTASSAPSGAHKQPWTFCVVSDPKIKRKIRLAAEEEEKLNYTSRMSETWKEDLKPLGTKWEKPFLEEAPYLIVVFKQSYSIVNGEKRRHYYVNESVGIACGFLLAAIHQAGLVAVTHTPSPMSFLSNILDRPFHEKPFLLIPVGFPKEEVYVPNIQRKPLDQIMKKF